MKRQNSTARNFTIPKLVKSGNDWYVFTRFYHGNKWHLKKFKEGLNRITDLRERKRQFDLLAEARNQWLQQGWNPVIDPDFKSRKIAELSATIKEGKMTFNEALDFALAKKRPDLAKKSYQDYHNIIDITKASAVEFGLSILPVKEVKRFHIRELLDNMRTAREWSNHRYNIYLGCIRSMFTTLEGNDIVDFNPAAKIETKEVAESNLYATFTEGEKIKIAEYLNKRHFQLFLFMQWIYHSGIRPKELLALQIKDIDLARRVIMIEPDLKRENSKTKFLRPVPVSQELYKVIRSMGLNEYPSEFYVFGSIFKPGEGNRGTGTEKWGRGQKKGFGRISGRSGSMRKDFLMPSPYHVKRDTVTKLWKKLIKEDLGINKCLYAGKHTGADDKIIAGIDLDSLRNLYGHRSKWMTERYAKAVQEVYNKQIIDKSPAFITGKIRRIAS